MDEITSLIMNRIDEIEQRDETQILAELAGETIEDFIYEIKTYDKKAKKEIRTVKLSWAGTREMARFRGNITLDDPMITDQDGYVRIVVRGTDLTRNFSIFGGCHQPKRMKVKIFDEHDQPMGYQEQDDPYYFTKALSKAQRNVLQAVIPADFTARMIDRFLLKSGKQPLKQLPRPKAAAPPKVNTDVPEPTEFKTLLDLEKYAFNRWHLQPAEVYRELGYKNKADCAETPWECYLKLKATIEG